MRKDAEEVTQALRKCIKEMNLDDDFHTIRTRCIGRCDDAPVAVLAPDNIWLKHIDYNECESLLNEIQSNEINNSENFLYKMGEKTINSDSVPTKYRKKPQKKKT